MTGLIERPRAAAVAAALAALGTYLTVAGYRADSGTLPMPRPASPPPVSTPTTAATVPAPSTPAPAVTVARTLRRSVPARLDIPAIGVHTDLSQLGLNPNGTVEVPPPGRDAPAGWYRNSVTPGEVGPAVILGHVDSARDGPAVFYRLADLRPGDRIVVRRADRTTATFEVDAVTRAPKSDFPTGAVYGPTAGPTLRLITCGGAFDRRHKTYRDNIIVTATYAGLDAK